MQLDDALCADESVAAGNSFMRNRLDVHFVTDFECASMMGEASLDIGDNLLALFQHPSHTESFLS